MRQFIICVNNSNSDARNAITAFLKGNNVIYWHWFNEVWLIVDKMEKWTAESLRIEINKVAPNCHNLVMQHEGKTSFWAGYGNADMFKWLHESWNK